jgi:hypothetical protein
VMINILGLDPQLALNFADSLVETNNGEILLEILLDCTDSAARSHIGDLFRFLLCMVKGIEREQLLGDDHHNTVSAKWLKLLVENLHVRAAKSWARFDKYLELYYSFAVETEQDILDSMQNIQGVSKLVEGKECRIGLEYLFKVGVLE